MFKYQIYSNLLINLILFKSKCGIREKKTIQKSFNSFEIRMNLDEFDGSEFEDRV